VHEALGTLTVALADSPTTYARRALLEPSPENLSTDGAFAEVPVDPLTTPGRRALSDSPPDNTSAEVPTDSPSTQVSPAFSESTTESAFAEVLAEVMSVERVSVDSNFFDDLGADSMVMARFCARVRKRPDLPSVSIKDIYEHPTITSLAAALGETAPVSVESPAAVQSPTPTSV
jgi:acyl carrier protein